MDAYERVLGDAMNGDRTLFARQDYVEEAWRIVDPALAAGTGLSVRARGWGPKEADNVSPRTLAKPGRDANEPSSLSGSIAPRIRS